ncbi:MAG: hypothetical protein ABIK92_02365 [Pseudomonadota bacterium]
MNVIYLKEQDHSNSRTIRSFYVKTGLALVKPTDLYVLTHAFDMELLFVCGVALLAAIITFMRGNDRPKIKHK